MTSAVDIEHIWEKFVLGVFGLGFSRSSLQDKLRDAYSHLSGFTSDHFPNSMREDFIAFQNIMTRVENIESSEDFIALEYLVSNGDGSNGDASPKLIGDSEAKRLIEKILSLYERVSIEYRIIDDVDE